MEHTKHIWRAILILIAIALVGIVARHFLLPASFGMRGHYRYDSLGEYMSMPLVHGSVKACAECHEGQFALRSEGKHASVSCEVCHMPVTTHVKDGETIAEMPINLSHKLCAVCHQKMPARSDTMPQVDIKAHLIEQEMFEPGAEIAEGICTACHDVHAPGI